MLKQPLNERVQKAQEKERRKLQDLQTRQEPILIIDSNPNSPLRHVDPPNQQQPSQMQQREQSTKPTKFKFNIRSGVPNPIAKFNDQLSQQKLLHAINNYQEESPECNRINNNDQSPMSLSTHCTNQKQITQYEELFLKAKTIRDVSLQTDEIRVQLQQQNQITETDVVVDRHVQQQTEQPELNEQCVQTDEKQQQLADFQQQHGSPQKVRPVLVDNYNHASTFENKELFQLLIHQFEKKPIEMNVTTVKKMSYLERLEVDALQSIFKDPYHPISNRLCEQIRSCIPDDE